MKERVLLISYITASTPNWPNKLPMLVLYLLGMFGKVVYEEFMIILYVVKLNGTDQENKDYFVNF